MSRCRHVKGYMYGVLTTAYAFNFVEGQVGVLAPPREAMNSTAVETIRSLLLSTSRAVVNLESNTLRIPRRLRMFTDADVPELQLLQAAYLLALVSYALVFNPLTELLFPFPGGGARARRMSVAIPLLAWASLVMVSSKIPSDRGGLADGVDRDTCRSG